VTAVNDLSWSQVVVAGIAVWLFLSIFVAFCEILASAFGKRD
jgi:hypothetical protein